MKVSILSDSGRVEFPASHVGVTISGTVHITGDTADGQPYSIEVSGQIPDGRGLVDVLVAMRTQMDRTIGDRRNDQ